MTSTTADPIAELFDDVDTPCDGVTPTEGDHVSCPDPAEWVVRFVDCCPAEHPVLLLCTERLEHHRKTGQIRCALCGYIFRPAATALASVEPLRKAP